MLDAARIAQQVEVQMWSQARRRRDLAPCIDGDPSQELPGSGIVRTRETPITRPYANEYVGHRAIGLIEEWVTATEQIASDFTSHFANQRRIRFHTQIIISQVVSKQLPVLEHRINGLPQKPGIGADSAH